MENISSEKCAQYRAEVYEALFTFNTHSEYSERTGAFKANKSICNCLATGTIIVILYALVCVVGITGNSLTLFVALRRPRVMFTNRNLFILNLALADLVLCAMTTPMNLVSNVYLQVYLHFGAHKLLFDF